MSRKRVGIFGGSFNPVHFGHIRLARQLRQLAGLDEVWLMVSPQNPFKTNQTLLDEREKGLVASDFEFRLPKPSYTWNTLQALAQSFPEHEFTLLIGADNWISFPKWYHADDILSRYSIVVYPRTDSDIDVNSLPPNVTLVNTRLIPISSTQVRRRITEGKSIERLVPKAVARLIHEEHLY